MIDAKQSDCGARVKYTAHEGAEPEYGMLNSLPWEGHPQFGTHAWVRFRGPNGELTPLENLEWA